MCYTDFHDPWTSPSPKLLGLLLPNLCVWLLLMVCRVGNNQNQISGNKTRALSIGWSETGIFSRQARTVSREAGTGRWHAGDVSRRKGTVRRQARIVCRQTGTVRWQDAAVKWKVGTVRDKVELLADKRKLSDDRLELSAEEKELSARMGEYLYSIIFQWGRLWPFYHYITFCPL